MPSESSTVAQSIAQMFKEIGIRRVHGVPGEDHLQLLHELIKTGIRYIAARDESAAAIMAATEAQATGLPGVVIVTLAPGLTNALNGVASAYLDHLPLIVICGQHAWDRYATTVRQTLDNHAVMRPLTKWTTVAGRQIHQTLAKVIDTAMAPPAGPVFLEIEASTAAAPAADAAADWPPMFVGGRTFARANIAAETTEDLRNALSRSQRPIIIVGSRAHNLASSRLAALATLLSTPVFTSPDAKGILGDDHPWWAGVFVHGNIEAEILNRADTVVAIGCAANDIFNVPWSYTADLVAIEPDRANTEHFLPVKSQVVGDLDAVVDALLEEATTSNSIWTENDVAEYRAHVAMIFCLDEEALTIPTAIAEARAVLPATTYVTIDAGFGKSLHSLLWAAREPNSCFSSQGLSTMGYAIPAANALKLAFPDRPVVGFLGDGSMLMRASEIGVASHHGIAPIYVVWMDGELSQIGIKQRRQTLTMVGVDLGSQSCQKIADAFGGTGIDVWARSEFRDALHSAISSSVPMLIGAHVDQSRRDGWFEQLRG